MVVVCTKMQSVAVVCRLHGKEKGTAEAVKSSSGALKKKEKVDMQGNTNTGHTS